MSKDFTIKVNGVEIKPDSLYQIIPKKDDDAPDYYTKNGTSKLLMQGITDGAPCLFDSNLNVWDTGFYENSPCYRGWSGTDIKTQVEALKKHIVEPFEALRGKGTLSHLDTKDSFWLSYASSNIYNGKVFNTAKPDDLLELYIALLGKHVCSKKDENSPFQKKAKYLVENKDAVVGVREERQRFKAEAIASVFKLKEVNKEKLKEVLTYLGLPATDDDGLVSVVMDYVENSKEGHNNSKRLVETINKVNSKSGAIEINIYGQLLELFRKGSISKVGSEYFLGEDSIGLDLKSAALTIKKSKPLQEKLKKELVKLED